MSKGTVTLVVTEGSCFGYNGRTYTEGDSIDIPAEHVGAWLERALVERPERDNDEGQTPGTEQA
ncbi:hypothetical protein F9278_23170 [Streptomyces phaeolivaceus]|uniref:Uncharacterized protein n=1 Tax=Streptomyces phaeolivaceus TaxID=2653200 RepID=A0A5P8K642_9ACTN|nr:hypothetical protein [Streptomyces phaeolivaceus]QFQ98581.1 hypothetical protein F9278_23170 [Streptomyces phaeolivaceus]